MSIPIIATKLYIPSPRTRLVLRPRLLERLNECVERKLTLVSAPAGFGKSTLVSEWCSLQRAPVAWLSLDEGDNDPAHFLVYFITALQSLAQAGAAGLAAIQTAGRAMTIGAGVLSALQSPQPPPPPKRFCPRCSISLPPSRPISSSSLTTIM